MSVLKLGTRKSLLAWAQSGWVARRLEELNPGLKIELVGIETQGDRILDVSLRKIEGKEFFVAELDHALRDGRVDLTVHSMKDLSLQRPGEFVLGCIPKRENSRDVILFGPGVLEKIRGGKVLKIGTSSPRRLENIPPFLERALPVVGGKRAAADFVEIRGNVNTRLSRVHEPAGSEKALDAVVLAFAGLIRLWADEVGRAELRHLLEGVRWMVLPLRECPTAPAQGALAVECRAADEHVLEMLGKLHDPATAARVARERALLAEWGGGCHQKFGATCVSAPVSGEEILYIRGEKSNGEFVESTQWLAPRFSGSEALAWDGTEWRWSQKSESQGAVDFPQAQNWFIAHSRALPQEWASRISTQRVWTSGVPSWLRLAEMGIWVEGCAENLGFESVESTLKEGVLQLSPLAEWNVLTHEAAVSDWTSMQPVSTYRLIGDYPPMARAALERATHIYWSSGSQFEELGRFGPNGAAHACGPGKTAERLREAGVICEIFPSVEEWRKWIGKNLGG